MGKRRYWIALFLFFWLAVGISGWFYTQSGKNSPLGGSAKKLAMLHAGDHIPSDLTLEDLAGKKIFLGEIKDKVLLINFWAAWCGPCLEEMPAIYAAQKAYSARGLMVLGMDMDDDVKDGARSLERKIGPPPFTIYKGSDSDLFNSFEISGVPFSVLVDKAGNIRYAAAGEVDWMSQEMRQVIEGVL